MKKRILSAVALTMALSMTFGMTVFASSNNSVKADDVKSDTLVSAPVEAGKVTVSEDEKATLEAESKAVLAVISAPEGATLETLTAAELKDAKSVAAKIAESNKIANASVNVLAGADIDIANYNGVSFTITLSKAVDPSAELLVLHLNEATNVWETLKATVAADGKTITIYTSSLSPIVIAEVKAGQTAGNGNNSGSNNAPAAPAAPAESPKTGAVASAAGIMAGICLAGAAVSAKKVRKEN